MRAGLEPDRPAVRSRMPAHLVAHLGEFVSVCRADGTVIATNHEMPGGEDAAGRDSLGYVHPEDREQVARAFSDLVADPEARVRTLVRVKRGPHDPYRWLETTGVNRLDDPAVRGLVFVSRDVEDRVLVERLAARSSAAQQLVAELGVRVLREAELEPALVVALAEVARLLGAASVTLLEADPVGDLRVTWQHGERPLPPGHLLPAGAGPQVPESVERGIRAVVEAPLLDRDGEHGRLVAGFLTEHEVDDVDRALLQGVANVVAGARMREQHELAAVVRALHDPLTGLPTRPLLLDRLDHALARTAREGVSEVAVLLVDLDGFKAVNDAHGHAAGDVLLAQLGERLATGVRPGDTAARLGGDEFVVLCEDVRDQAAVEDLRDRVRAVFDDPFAVPGVGQLRLTGSIGAALSAAAGNERAALLHAADLDMYRDKRARAARR